MKVDEGVGLGSGKPIVVGVDGSEGSIRALKWATDFADRNEQGLEVVFVLSDCAAVNGLRVPDIADELSVVQVAGDELARTVLRTVGEDAACEIAPVIISAENAAAGLTDASQRAWLLVVGSGKSGDQSLRPGSTSTELLRSATCPVVVIPAGILGLKKSLVSLDNNGSLDCDALGASMVEA